ncbi:MAG: serine/threonine-protein kinase [Verrucomicrobiota bacterium]
MSDSPSDSSDATTIISSHAPGSPAPTPEELMRRALETSAAGALHGWEAPTVAEMAALLPQYEISALIDRGGMAAVYLGRQPGIDRAVAVKVMPPELAADAEFVARFRREVRTLGKLQHPGIVSVYESGQTGAGHVYFVMEHVAGGSLARLIHHAGLTSEQALELTMQICEALQYAHTQGVIHRDIKPQNVLMTPDGRAKLADFGLARPMHPEGTGLTKSHVSMGTLAYMAPEQCAGLELDQRADIYALGVMLYEMLTGSRPQGAFEPPSHRAHVDVRLDEVVMKAMRQEPERRYQHVSELQQDVSSIREATTRPAQPYIKRPKKASNLTNWIALAATVPVMAFFGFIIWETMHDNKEWRSIPPPAETESEVAALSETPAKAAVLVTKTPEPPPAPEPMAESPAAPKLGDDLASRVFVLLRERCGECHSERAESPDEFAIIENFVALRTSDYLNLKSPESSMLYVQVRDGDMPLKSQADREAKRKPVSFTDEENALLLSWIKTGAPDPGSSAVAAPAAATSIPGPARSVVSLAAELRAVMDDLQSLPAEAAADTRYVSLAAAHNNSREVSAKQVDLMRQGVRKVLNSLSTNPRIATFEEVGPEKVLFRVRLRDLGWDAMLWERITSFYPFAVETSLSAAMHIKTPVVRADWLAATATRAPLYNELLRLPDHQQELEAKLGVNVFANLAAGEALRSGFTKSGVSRHNRLAERHDMRAYGGYYWLSYDFKESGGRANLHTNPLGPDAAHLLGGTRAFEHAGGEIVFSLPNGMNGYYVSDVTGKRLDGAVPTEIVSDRTNITGRAEVSNAMACMICHDRGIKQLPRDEIRPLAKTYGADEQRLVEMLHPPQDKIDAVVHEDTQRFLAALKAAGITAEGGSEPVSALFKHYDLIITLAEAAAEMGLTVDDFQKQLGPQIGLFDVKTLLEGDGMSREHFLDKFADIITRLNLGTVRGSVVLPGLDIAGREDSPSRGRPIAVKLSADKTHYRAGEIPVIRIQASQPAHLRLLYQDASGAIVTLFPNALMPDDRIPGGGQAFQLMPARSQTNAAQEVAIEITGPVFGMEQLVALVSDRPFADGENDGMTMSKGATFMEESSKDIESVISKAARLIARPVSAETSSVSSSRPASSATSPTAFARITPPARGLDRLVLHTAP